jgi:DNA-binding CsgD family transcriptional regulator
MSLHADLRILGLTHKEERVLLAVRDGIDTPLELSRTTHISRPTIYLILSTLKRRGLVESRIRNGRRYWRLCDEREIDQVVANAKRAILKNPQGREEVYGISDSTVIVHRGKSAIKKLLLPLFASSKQERFLWGFQGDTSTIGWNRVFTVTETNRINRDIKNNNVITEAFLPEGWFEEQVRVLGVKWAKDFEGRTTRVNVLDPKYFKHGGQCFLFKNSLYLFALNEELVVEVRNSEIQRMIRSIFAFMQDNSRTIDANTLLRSLMDKDAR